MFSWFSATREGKSHSLPFIASWREWQHHNSPKEKLFNTRFCFIFNLTLKSNSAKFRNILNCFFTLCKSQVKTCFQYSFRGRNLIVRCSTYKKLKDLGVMIKERIVWRAYGHTGPDTYILLAWTEMLNLFKSVVFDQGSESELWSTCVTFTGSCKTSPEK